MAIMHTDTRTVQRVGVANEHAFTIKASAKAFGVLTSNLYSDKPLAIVRELCTNAYDSHVAAGKADVPFEVILPTRLNSTLTIKDFGLGLDHDGVINIYTKFFESTKTESNDFVGQLGLGSKAPFSMFKTFNVEARKDGVKRIYTAYTNEDGIPTIAQMGETMTDEPNGLTISMHVKADDAEKFVNAAKRALMYFNPKPLVNGVSEFSTYTVKHGLSGSNWKVRESDYWARMNGPYVVQGFVVYPIDGAIIQEHSKSAAVRTIAGLNIDFWMPIGSVDVAPSREALSYDKTTIANVIAAFEAAAAEMRSVIQAEFDKCKTAYEAGCLLHKHQHDGAYEMRQLFNSMHADQPFTWNGKTITYKYELDVKKIRSTTIVHASSTGRKLAYNSRYEPTDVDVKREVQLTSRQALIIDDVHRGTGDVLQQFLRARGDLSSVLVLRATKKSEHDEKEIKRIVKMLGDAPVQRVSELPYKPTVAKGAKGREAAQRLKFTGFKKSTSRWGSDLNRKFSRLTWQVEDVDLSKGGFYLPLERFAIVWNGGEMNHIDEIMSAAKVLGLVTDADLEKTYGFNEKEISKAGKNWVNFFDHIVAQFKALKAEDKIAHVNAARSINDHMESFNRGLGRRWSIVEPKLVDGAFKTFVNKVRAMNDQALKVQNAEVFDTFVRRMGLATDIDAKTAKARNALQAEWYALLKSHGILSIIDWYKVDDSTMQMVVDYINLVNAQ
jgi:hypothetical protein